jgi:hypothetical protein
VRVTEQILDNDAAVRGWFTAERGWFVWSDDRGKRQRSVPTIVAVHLPSRMVLAIYARPRKLRPSEMPDTSWLVSSWIPVVWWPGMHIEVRAWLATPHTDVPGAVLTTRDGAT